MSKFNAEQRSALQSARAKNRKLVVALGAAGLAGVKVPAKIVRHIQATEAYFAELLDSAKVAVVAEAPETEDDLYVPSELDAEIAAEMAA